MKHIALVLACSTLVLLGSVPASSAAPARSAPALTAFADALAAVTAYNATITVFEQQGLKVQNVIFKYTFRRPSTVTVDVVGGPNNGVSLLWTGGTTVSAHRGKGMSGVFKETLSLHDPKVTTIRGSSIDELSFDRILAHAQQTAGKISQGPGLIINDVPTDAVTLIPTHPAPGTYTREIIEISKTTRLPMRVLGYQGATLVRRIDVVDAILTQ
jgi:hypothetical protein